MSASMHVTNDRSPPGCVFWLPSGRDAPWLRGQRREFPGRSKRGWRRIFRQSRCAGRATFRFWCSHHLAV